MRLLSFYLQSLRFETQRLDDEVLILADETQRLDDEVPILDGEVPILTHETQGLADKVPILANETQINHEVLIRCKMSVHCTNPLNCVVPSLGGLHQKGLTV